MGEGGKGATVTCRFYIYSVFFRNSLRNRGLDWYQESVVNFLAQKENFSRDKCEMDTVKWEVYLFKDI